MGLTALATAGAFALVAISHPPTTFGTTSCFHDFVKDFAVVSMPAGGDTATILREKTDHVVVNASTCAGGGETETLNNTVRVIVNRSPGDQAVTLDLSGGDFGVIDFFIKCSPGPSMCSYAKVALASEGG